MFRKICLGMFVAAAVFASAQAGVQGALGAGQANNGEGAHGTFALSFIRRTAGDGSVRVAGSCLFVQRSEGQRPIEIKMLRATAVTVDGHACHAEGRGGYQAVVNGQRVRKEGVVVVDVVDNRPPRATDGTPDTFHITFTATDGSVTHNFMGALNRGDIKVGSRS